MISSVASSHRALPLRALPLLACGVLFACFAACFTGCREHDEVHSYKVDRKLEEERIVKIREARVRMLEQASGKAGDPHADMPRNPMPRPNVPAGKPEPGRLIGVLLPHGGEMWFFKVLGPDEAVKRSVDQVKAFVTTVKFQGADPVWTVPAGWTEEPGDGISWASFIVDAGPPAIKLAASRFPGQQDLTANVNRWRNQVGLPNVDDAEAAKALVPLETAAGPAMWAELTGTYTPKSGMGGPFSGGPFSGAAGRGPMAGPVDPKAPLPAGHPTAEEMKNTAKEVAEFSNKRPSPLAPLPDAPFKYELPAGWEPGEPSRFNLAAFTVAGAGGSARITVSEAGGDLLSNINRWRAQELGLPEIDENQLLTATTKVKLSGRDADYIELIGPAGSSGPQATLGVVAVKEPGTFYFVKLKGSAPIVQSEKERFLKFVTSIRFDR